MPTFLLVVFILATAFLLVRQWQMQRYLRNFSEAARSRRHFLISEHTGKWLRRSGLTSLTHTFNDLLSERNLSDRKGKSYLQQIEATLGSLTEAVLIVDSRYQVVMANPAARSLLGLANNWQGKRLEQLVSSAKFFEYMHEPERTGAAAWREIELKRESGHRLFLEVTRTRIPHDDANADGLTLIVLHNITRLKELENVRRDFVANVSHELRTPVTIIKGYSDALIEDHERLNPDERLRFLQKIQKSVHRLHLLLEDLLTLARLEGGSASVGINLDSVALHKLITEQVEPFNARLASNQSLLCEFDPHIDCVNLDPIKIGQVLHNILDNSLRYARGFSAIRIQTELMPDKIILAVEDDGCGIPEKDLAHIFERFYTVDKGRSREFAGTGLGLSIVKHIVQLHSGQVKATSRKGGGLRIECHLPLL